MGGRRSLLDVPKPAVGFFTGLVVLVGTFIWPVAESGSPALTATSVSSLTPVTTSSMTTVPVMTTTAETTATAETTTTAASTTTMPIRSAVTLAFAGDILPHIPVTRRAANYGARVGLPYDYSPMFEPMRPVLESVDMAVCHMEVPISREGDPPTGYPSFGAPPEIVAGIRTAGFDGCSTASNHSLDRGLEGLGRLLDVLDLNGLKHNGTARSEVEGDGRATVYDIDDVRIAHLSWSYGFNGYRLPDDAPWAANYIDTNRIRTRAAQARLMGADLVVVSLHWGSEYQHEPTDQQLRLADEITRNGDVDLIVGHHAHVVQPISKVNGTYVVWGLGNQLSNQRKLPRRHGLTVRVTAQPDTAGRWRVAEIQAVPTFVELPSYRVLPVVETLEGDREPLSMQDELRSSYARTAGVLGTMPTDGVSLAPLP